MALTRAYEVQEVSPELKRIYADIRSSFDVPFVPTIFKLTAGVPEYLRTMWSDLGEVARSREFQAASNALEEFAHSQAIFGGWQLSDQRKAMAGQKFSSNDIEVFKGVVSTFSKSLPQVALFARLMQLGYSGGQRGRVGAAKQASALSRIVTLHVPNEREAGLRTWLIYSDIKRKTNSKHVLSVFRVLAPFPGYLASVWLDSKKLMREPAFLHSCEAVAQRSRALLNGLPVRDHRRLAKGVSAAQWREIEATLDGMVNLLPQFALFVAVWQRSFPSPQSTFRAA